MNLWIDCEFNGYCGDLISIALVDAEGREFYEVTHCHSLDDWVAENVIPVLDALPVSILEIQDRLYLFLKLYKNIHIIADWPEDIMYFCELLIIGAGKRIDTPPLTMEIRRDLNSEKSLVPHNALSDARAIRQMELEINRREK